MKTQIDELRDPSCFAAQVEEAAHVWQLRGKPHSIGAILRQPAARIELSRTLEVPVRGSLIGPSPHVRDHCYFFPDNAFAGEWLIGIESDNTPDIANDLFGMHVRDVEAHCRGRTNGIAWGGAQGSTMENVRVVEPKEFGISIQKGSRLGAFRGVVEVRGGGSGDHGKTAESTVGLKSYETCSWSGGTFHFHQLDLGLKLNRCCGWGAIVVGAEHTDQPLQIRNSEGIEVCMTVRTAGELLFDLTGSRGVRVYGSVSNNRSDEVSYIDHRGERRSMGGGAKGNKGVYFDIRT